MGLVDAAGVPPRRNVRPNVSIVKERRAGVARPVDTSAVRSPSTSLLRPRIRSNFLFHFSLDPMTAPTRAAIHQHRERGVPSEAAAILTAGYVAHVGIADEHGPVVIPMTYQFDAAEPDALYLHGALNSRLMAAVASGAPVCVTVTMVDGLVYSKTALNHSVNYRSVVCFCRAAESQPDDTRKRALLDAMIGRYWPGRGPDAGYAPMPDAHLNATAFVALRIEEMSAKQRTGGSKGPGDDDPTVPGTAGVTELRAGL